MKYLYILLALFSLALGTIGVFLPILPTTPFYLLTIILFSKSSERLELWFKNTKLYKKNLKDFYETRSMDLRLKIFLLVFVSSIIFVVILLYQNLTLSIILLSILIIKYYYFIFHIKNR